MNKIRVLRQMNEFMAPPIAERVRIYEVNEGTIKMAKIRVSNRRTRHLDVKHHTVRDAIDGGAGLCKTLAFGGTAYRYSHKGVKRKDIRKAREISSELPTSIRRSLPEYGEVLRSRRRYQSITNSVHSLRIQVALVEMLAQKKSGSDLWNYKFRR